MVKHFRKELEHRKVTSEVLYLFRTGSKVQWYIGRGKTRRLIYGTVVSIISPKVHPKYPPQRLARFPHHWFRNKIVERTTVFPCFSFLVEVKADVAYPWWPDAIGHMVLYWPDVNRLLPYNSADWARTDATQRFVSGPEKVPVYTRNSVCAEYVKHSEYWERRYGREFELSKTKT